MATREAFMVTSAEPAVALRQAKVAALANPTGITAYLEHLWLAVAQYSRGDQLPDVRAAVRQAVTCLENEDSPRSFDFKQHDQYYGALWGLSLSMLFGDASTAFLQRGAGQDAVYDRLLAFTGALVAPVTTLVRPLPYAHWCAAAEAPALAETEIPACLSLWYAAMGQTAWHDAHLAQDPHFFGYWAFEVAALVKAKSISDGSFADHIFYPRDLVHQRLFRTWLDGSEGETDRRLLGAAKAQARLEEARHMLLAFFQGTQTLDAKGAQSMGDTLRMVSGLLGLTTESLQENPEILRMGLLTTVRSILSLSKSALASSENSSDPKFKQVREAFQKLQQQFGGEGTELAEAAKIFSEFLPKEDGGSDDPKLQVDAAKTRIETAQQAFSGLVADEAIPLPQLMDGLDRIFKEYGAQLGITPAKPYDAYESTSKEVGKALDEANKKNMIGPDFDWSSLWKKS